MIMNLLRVSLLLLTLSDYAAWSFIPHSRLTTHPSTRTAVDRFSANPRWSLHAKEEGGDDSSPKKPKAKKRKKPPTPNKKTEQQDKEKLVQEIGQRMRETKSSSPQKQEEGEESNLLDRLNPFKAGQKLRQSIDTALTTISTEQQEQRAMYYLNDRLIDGKAGGVLSERPSLSSDRLDQDDYIPEILVIGATGEVGRLVVRRLLQQGNCRVRVLVRDLYTKTLNMLGAGVTYCQGDLSNLDSLEYALTDVDKIVFCASAPRPDEDQFREKFKEYMQETLEVGSNRNATSMGTLFSSGEDSSVTNTEWEQLEAVLNLRSELAEQVDWIGMQNLLRSYQNVRHADYGTSQAAKRSLFKFQSRPEDFNLFSLDDGSDAADDEDADDELPDYTDMDYSMDDYDEEEEEDDDDYGVYEDDDYKEYESLEKREDASVKTQVQWMRNKFGRAVFVGRIPKATSGNQGGDAAVVSGRLRSREDPDNGIDLSNFGGFVARVCSDGGKYEAFIRTRSFYDDGIEYVCQFTTGTKPTGRNKSKNKFVSVRLPFEMFKPVRTAASTVAPDAAIPPFRGGDVRNLGFRYRSSSNEEKSALERNNLANFYMALSYIKLYRLQPEPEFVYLSDARIPPSVTTNMVRHDAKQILPEPKDGDDSSDSMTILDDSLLQSVMQDKSGRSPEETYYKYRGEEALKMSGLSYTIVRVVGFNEDPSGEASTIELQSETGSVTPVSRDEVAQVCVNALLDPNALNKSFYVGKKAKGTSEDEDISNKFEQLPADAVI